VLYDKDQYASAVLGVHPLLYHLGSKRRQVMQQVTVLLKDGPKILWHGKANADVPNIRKQGSHHFLPQERGAIAAARASS
jgi:hypothetical protein